MLKRIAAFGRLFPLRAGPRMPLLVVHKPVKLCLECVRGAEKQVEVCKQRQRKLFYQIGVVLKPHVANARPHRRGIGRPVSAGGFVWLSRLLVVVAVYLV